MRRSLCVTDPKYIRVATIGTWCFRYTPSANLPKGTLLKFDPLSNGRGIDWQQPQTNLKNKANLIWLEMPNGKAISGKSLEKKNKISLEYEFTLPEEIKAGETISICLGSPQDTNLEKEGNKPQEYIQRRRPFNLHIDPKGKGQYKETETFHIDVRGGPLDHITILVPSVVSKNQRFDVIIRFEDCYNNLTNLAPEGTLVELGYDQLRENLNWKLFVPETGFITLPNFYFNEPGIYKLKLKNLGTGELFTSAPIRCEAGSTDMIYWGLLHGESERYDSQENIESALRYFRDERALHFYSTSHFESEEETPQPIWKGVMTQISEFNEDDRFNTFLGFTFQGNPDSEGVRHIIFSKDNKPILRKKEAKSSGLKKIYKSHTPKEILAIPSFTMAKGLTFDFSQFTPEFERVVEIYNAWGSSECKTAEGNLFPIKSSKNYQESPKGSIRDALNANHRFGFVAGGLDDRGIYEGLYKSDQAQYSPGLTAILAPTQTRDALFQALYNRRCYATTGARIIMSFSIAGLTMGSEMSTKAKPGLFYNRHISGYIAGTDEIKEVTIFRNGVPFKTFKPKESSFEFAEDDLDPLEKNLIKSSDDRPPFLYYYMRVIQKDGHVAWSSPIWIDYEEPAKASAPPKKKK